MNKLVDKVPDGYALVSIDALKSWGKYDEVRNACQFPAEQAEQEPVIECDCETSISSDGSRLTKCGSDQMRRAVEQGHAFCKQQAEQELFDMSDHPPHRLCECRKCMEYFTPLPDCDAFAASGKPIAEQEPVAVVEITYGREPECYVTGNIDDFPEGVFKLYAAPVQQVDLTDDEIMKINVDTAGIVPTCDRQFHFARAVIAADREKNK